MPHIPASLTRDAGVLTYEEALRPTGQTAYDRSRWLYVPDHYSEYRYILGTCGKKPLICIGINPSTAAPDDLDNTLKSAQRVALANGYDSFIMFNVYAQRATDPDDMEKEMNPFLHAENMKAFRDVLTGRLTDPKGLSDVSDQPTEAAKTGLEKPALWAAWGTLIMKRPWLRDCVRDMIALGQEAGADWYTAGKRSAAGHPHHPLYLKKDAPLEPFDPVAYLASLSGEKGSPGQLKRKKQEAGFPISR